MDRTTEEPRVARVLRAVRLPPSAAVAAFAVAGVALWLLTYANSGSSPVAAARANNPEPVPVPQTVNPAARLEWFRAVPPAIVLYSPGALRTRGGEAAPFTEAFDEAIAPWQAGNYAEAALRLDALASSYPAIAEAHFYRGAAWLLAGLPYDAVAPLRRAMELAPEALQADAAWYLALALLQTQQTDAALTVCRAGCTAGDARACRAADHLQAVVGAAGAAAFGPTVR